MAHQPLNSSHVKYELSGCPICGSKDAIDIADPKTFNETKAIQRISQHGWRAPWLEIYARVV